MSRDRQEPLTGQVIEDDAALTLAELCRCCGVPAELVAEMVDYGIIDPITGEGVHWRFTAVSIRRVTTVVRLQRDLGVNLAGAALALDLLEEIDRLRRRF